MYYMNNDNEHNSFEQQTTDPILNHEDPVSYTKKHNKRKGRMGLAIAATSTALVVGMVAGVMCYSFYQGNGGSLLASTTNASASTTESTTADKEEAVLNTVSSEDKDTTTDSSVTAIDVSSVVSDAMPSIVSVTNSAYVSNYQNNTSGFGQYNGQSTTNESSDSSNATLEEASVGTGIIVSQTDDTLYVVTNYHVVEGADAVSVTFSDEKTVDCEIKGYDSDADLAVLAINISDISSDTLSAVKVATLGDSSSIEVGDAAIAIGNALGYGQSVTTGVISATEREVQLTDSTMTLLQTDAAINPGNSGGALLNSKGEVIGINTVKYSSEEVEGMGYAIPISNAIPIIQELMNAETVPESEQGYLGITGVEIDEQYQQMYSMPAGVYVSSVESGSPAAAAGLTEGMIITSIDGDAVTTMDELSSAIKSHAAGDSVEITVSVANQGQYESQTVTATLTSQSTTTE